MTQPIPYPRRLYPGGIVDHSDPFAKASIVVESAEEEDEARSRGFRKAYEVDPVSGGNGGSEASAPHFSVVVAPAEPQGGVAPASADPIHDELPEESTPVDELDALRAEAKALGLKPYHKAGVAKLREMIAEARAKG